MHPWHDLSAGDSLPEIVTALIEISKGSRAKYEIDKVSGLLKLDRVLYSAMYYPTNYGFIPRTYCGDRDPLDILVISQMSLEPRSLVDARPIGVMKMIDDGADDKIIAVAVRDMSVAHIRDISELPESFRQEILNFFEIYKILEKKTIHIEQPLGRAAAHDVIRQATADYQEFIVPTLKK